MADHPFEPRDVLVVVARRVGFCEGCGTRILPGEEIVKVDGRWLHVECSDDPERAA